MATTQLRSFIHKQIVQKWQHPCSKTLVLSRRKWIPGRSSFTSICGSFAGSHFFAVSSMAASAAFIFFFRSLEFLHEHTQV